jgi:hypothetical protein
MQIKCKLQVYKDKYNLFDKIREKSVKSYKKNDKLFFVLM